ncbi:NUDIX hydrolase N-terminal domain-containing protein [Aliiglaciecola sp. M165]|nr:NUDIX hydrolase N-terminal domain-containing protein [Aliiglaciecola sp. M165]
MSESTWLTQLKRLHAIAESGLAFSPEPFDVERYQEI